MGRLWISFEMLKCRKILSLWMLRGDDKNGDWDGGEEEDEIGRRKIGAEKVVLGCWRS